MRSLRTTWRVAGSYSVVIRVENGCRSTCLVEVGEFPAEVVDDAVRADGVDPGEQDEGAVAVRAGQPGQVADVGRSRLRKIRGRLVDLAGAAIPEQPAAVVVLVEAEGRIALEHLARRRGRGVVRRSR